MKSNLYIGSIVCLLAGLFSACNDEFLERYPLDEVSNETFWNTENDLATYNNTFYHMALDDNEVPIMMAHHNGFSSQRWSYYFLDGFADNLAPNHPRHTFSSR